MGLQECLLCSETLEIETEGKSNNSVESQIRSVFILRKILEISPSTCSNLLLRTRNNPSTWFSCCRECFVTVIEAERIFSELTKLEIKWKRLKTSLESKVLNCTQQKTSKRRPKRSKWEILQTIRLEAAKRLEIVSDRAERSRNRNHLSPTYHINIPPGEIITCDSDAVESDPLKIEELEDIKFEDFEYADEFLSPDFQQKSLISTVNDKNEKFERIKAADEDDSKSMEGSSDQEERHGEAESDFLPSENSDSEAEISEKNKKNRSGSRTQGKNVKTSLSRTRRKYVKKVQVGDFHCEYCPIVFTTELRKRMHEIRRHDVKNDFKCPLCAKHLSNEKGLLRHLKSVHSKKKSISDLPGTSKLDVPDVNLNGDGGNCETQPISGIGIENDETNNVTEPPCKTKETDNNVPPFKCDHCNKLFVSTEKMKEHANERHEQQNVTLGPPLPMTRKEHEEFSKRVIHYFENVAEKKKKVTVKHFMKEGKNRQTLYCIISRYLKSGTVHYKGLPGRPTSQVTPENICKVKAAFTEDPSLTVRVAARKLSMPRSTLNYIKLHKLGMKAEAKRAAPKVVKDQKAREKHDVEKPP